MDKAAATRLDEWMKCRNKECWYYVLHRSAPMELKVVSPSGAKGIDVCLLELGGAFARKAHSKESKAVAGDAVAGSLQARCVGVITHRKIAGSKLRRAPRGSFLEHRHDVW